MTTPNARPIPRPLNTTTDAIQRPSPHRSLSQQFTSSSPTRRLTSESNVDLPFDGPEGASRTIPRSRLNLEIGKDLSAGDLVESPKPASESTPTWKPSHHPRGRPLLHSDVRSVGNPSPAGTPQGGSQIETAIVPMPLPARPIYPAQPVVAKVRPSPSNPAKKDLRPKPYNLEVPPAAPTLPPNGFADFFPWTGNHPEDQFSESAIRQGYYDKAQMTQNETGSAKSAIFPSLKHKSGLQTLSSLFTSVLAQRRYHGQITSASTFKPPPRVTVTDTKREIWLKDLANPAIPLRRLSRSIPHGIRGKILLDQALSKNIPIERAVWLAKCVGANELRSFRRKGVSGTLAMGGEAKWIRDFTVCVEQFVESIIATCGEKDFKTRIYYAIRLATNFHSEHLLDREHYMDWLASALENSSQAKLPMWLLITQIYWKDLLQHRKYGRQLSGALLSHLAEASNTPDRDILAPLYDRLKQLLKDVMVSSPDCFVSPKMWAKYGDLVHSTFSADEEWFGSLLRSLDRRNKHLNKPETVSELNSRRRLLLLLDTTISGLFSPELPQRCWDIDTDKEMLASTVLEWSTSLRRPGVEKIFVGVRILRFWSRLGLDTTDAVLRFVEPGVNETTCDKAAFYQLVSELARSEHFSVARYLQWLMARGGIYDGKDVSKTGSRTSRLLAEIPTHNLSESICGLRATLLSRVGFKIEIEKVHTRSLMICMSRTLLGMQGLGDLDLETDEASVSGTVEDFILRASRTSKSEVGLWLRQMVKLQMGRATLPHLAQWDGPSVKRETPGITLSDFNTVKRYLDLLDDYSMLADVLRLVSGSSNADVLASCADSINLHVNEFAAIGALKNLFDLLMARTRRFAEEVDFVPRVLLVSLSDLASRLPEQKPVAQHLSRELARSDRKTAADACSPVSDHMALMQTAESDFTDEIEKVLASGNSMDKATLERLFQRISLRLEESFGKSPEQQRSCGLLLTRLKTFDAESFNVLMNAWVSRFLQIKRRPNIIQILVPLISFGCLGLLDVITTLISSPAKTSHPTTSQEALSLVLAIPDIPEAMSVDEACRFSIKQSHLQKDHPRSVLHVIREAMEGVSESRSLTLHSPGFHGLLQRLVLADTALVIQELVVPLLQKSDSAVIGAINSAVDGLLLCDTPTTPITAEMVLGLADDLSLPFCQIKLATMFTSPDSAMSGTEDAASQNIEAFDNAIESAVTAGRTSWASIVPLLDVSIAKHLRQRAATQFLVSMPTVKNFTVEKVDMQQRLIHARNLLHIVASTAHSISDEDSTANSSGPGSEIPTAFQNIWLVLASPQVQSSTKDMIIGSWLPLLLSFTEIHRDAFENTKAGNENRGKAVVALSAVYVEIESRESNTETVRALALQVYDLTLYLVDSLPDDVRLQSVKSLRDTTSLPRIRYLFSIATNPSESLVLTHRDKVVPGPLNRSAAAGSISIAEKERPMPFPLRRWEMLGDPTPNVGENDTSLSLTLFGARRG